MTGAMRAAAEGDARDKAKPRKPEDKACERGLAYLARTQKSDGSFPGKYSNVSCALASMAFMASGHFPGRGKYGDNLERAVLWLAGRPDERGYFGLDGGKMYGHGMCTLALAEAYGMLRTRLDNLKVRDSLEKAVNLVVACQGKPNHGAANGAWRYEPRPGDADLSITCWIIQAIRSAQNCQIKVPDETITLALDYMSRTYHPVAKGYAYTPGGSPSLEMRAGGFVVMNTLKQKELDQVKEAGRVLLNVSNQYAGWGGGYYYYRTYYAATAGKMLGEEGFKRLNTPIEKQLVGHQNNDGSWPDITGHSGQGNVYSTSFACMALAVRYQYLPIYQE